MNSQKALDILEQDFLSDAKLPLLPYRKKNEYKPMFGEGDSETQIMLIGEAPGREEAETGKPFIGSAGKQLNQFLAVADLERDSLYITSIIKDRLPKNRNPTHLEVKAYLPYLIEQIKIIKPEYLLTLGRVALDSLSPYIPRPKEEHLSLRHHHGETLDLEIDNYRASLIPMYHPAAIFYNPVLVNVITYDFYNFGKLVRQQNRPKQDYRTKHKSQIYL